jgi:hypothetical protein
MTLEQIVNTHPCPIIRDKIMENVNVPNYEKGKYLSEFSSLILYGINNWEDTKQGGDFWNAVYKFPTAPYSDLKHLDLSYVPELAKPLPVWRKIDPNNLPIDTVVAMHIDEPTIIFMGSLELDRHNEITLYISNGQYLPNFTHYIPLSDLINLPIQP